jgi:pimeloyl-ACP methyl ester carboxylesterase
MECANEATSSPIAGARIDIFHNPRYNSRSPLGSRGKSWQYYNPLETAVKEKGMDSGTLEPLTMKSSAESRWLGLIMLGAIALLSACSSSGSGSKDTTDTMAYVCVSPSFGGWSPPETTFSDGSIGKEYSFDSGVVTEGGTGSILRYAVFHPNGLACTAEDPCPVVLLMHGAGGGSRVIFRDDVREAATAHGFLLISVTNRIWKDLCTAGRTAADCAGRSMIGDAYVDSPNPVIGPGEQDILRALDHFTGARQDALGQVNPDYAGRVDVDSVYLAGNSLGGRGAYAVGLKNPDRFAALGMMQAPSDMRISWDYGRKEYHLAAIAGGEPGGPVFPGLEIPAGLDPAEYVETMWTITSGRYLIENAANLPLFFAHGDADEVVPNSAAAYSCTDEGACDTALPLCGAKRCEDYEHSRHMAANTGASSWCAGNEDWCEDNWTYVHRGSLTDLRAEFPGLYASDEIWTPGFHCWNADPSQNGPEDILWIEYLFDRFDGLQRKVLPDQVVYKSYTNTHSRAYWLSINPVEPWSGQPGMVVASRGAGRLEVALYRVNRLVLAMEDLEVDPGTPGTFTLVVSGYRLNALEDPRTDIEIRLAGLGVPSAEVSLNGNPLAGVAMEEGDLILSGVEAQYPGADTYEITF